MVPWAPAGMGKGGHFPLEMLVFLHISSYIKRLGRRIIYALFSQPVIGF